MVGVSEGKDVPGLEQLRDCLLDRNQPIAKRTHSAFFLRTLGTPEAVSAVGEGDDDDDDATHRLCRALLPP